METRDYTKYLPEVADECVRRWAEEHNWGRELLVYRDGWWRNPLTGKKEKCAVRAAHIGRAEYVANCYEWVMQLMHAPAERDDTPAPLILMFWRVNRWINKEAVQCLSAVPWEAYIVEERKIVRCSHWQGWFCGQVVINSSWRQVKTFRDEIRDIKSGNVISANGVAEDLIGTTAENSKLDLYMGLKEVKFPISYLRLWLWHRNIETLLTAGAGKLVAGMILEEKAARNYREDYSSLVPRLVEVDWKAKRPSQMLRMTREELRAAMKGGLNANGLRNWMAAKAGGVPVRLPEDIKSLNGMDRQEAGRIFAHGQRIGKAQSYIDAQRRRFPAEKRVLHIRTLCDYWDMAKNQGRDMTARDVLWPGHLMRAHDQMVMDGEFKESKELCIKFARRYKELCRYNFEADGLLIRPPTQERELLMEGKVLNHCVASYAKRHAQGDTTILFIRRVEDPDVPFYTLELSKDGERVIQNHGRRNCLQTPEIKAFEERWMAWQLAGCKRDKKGRPIEPVKKEKRESA